MVPGQQSQRSAICDLKSDRKWILYELRSNIAPGSRGSPQRSNWSHHSERELYVPSATYESPEMLDGSSNSTNDSALSGSRGMDGVIQILPGNRIPLTPQHTFKAYADVQFTRKISADLNFLAVSSSYARGNENNQSQPDGVYYLGPGASPGYGLVNLGARYQVQKRFQIFAQVNNLFDHPITRRPHSARRASPTRTHSSPGLFPL